MIIPRIERFASGSNPSSVQLRSAQIRETSVVWVDLDFDGFERVGVPHHAVILCRFASRLVQSVKIDPKMPSVPPSTFTYIQTEA